MQRLDLQHQEVAVTSLGMRLTASATAACAISVPSLIAYSVAPSATFFNQAAAVVGWGGLIIAAALACRFDIRRVDAGFWNVVAAIAVLLLAALGSGLFNELPWSLALSNIGMMAAAIAVILFGVAAAQGSRLDAVFEAVCIALLLAGTLSSVVGCLQVFAPDLTGGDFIAATSHEGRAAGNLRQPNHLSSLLSWSIVAAGWLMQRRDARWWSALISCSVVLMVLAMALSASRTGWIAIAMIAGWAAFDARLPRRVRFLLGLTPVIYVLSWLGLTLWAHISHQIFGGEARLTAEGDISSSRFGIWSNTISLILQHPLAGVGFGEFNFAWSLTPFPHRPVAFFDHTHNIALQFLVELGVPLGLAVLGLLGYALTQAMKITLEDRSERSATLSASTMAVLIIVVHSLLEYPLWYSYFLLPTAFFLGVVLARRTSPASATAEATAVPRASSTSAAAFGIIGVLVLAGGAVSLADYTRVTSIFSADSEAPLAQRIKRGQKSVFFAYQADYAADTTSTTPATAMRASRAVYNLLDTRLMMTWANAYAQRGDMARARYLAARLREFRNADSKAFFDACAEPVAAGSELPFQCQPDEPSLSYQDFKTSHGG